MDFNHSKLSYDHLTSCVAIDFKNVDECNVTIIGQEKAHKAVNFGLNVENNGYNIYIAGESGLGKTTYAVKSAKEKAASMPSACEYCYVYNFRNPTCPIFLPLNGGEIKSFNADMTELVDLITINLKKAFNSEEYEMQKHHIVRAFQNKKEELMKDLEDDAKEHNFYMKVAATGIYFMPVVDEKILNEEEYNNLPDDIRNNIAKKSDQIQDKAQLILKYIKDYEKVIKKEVDDLDYKTGLFTISQFFDELICKYKNEKIADYLNLVMEDVLENLPFFVDDEDEATDENFSCAYPFLKSKSSDHFKKYKINIINKSSGIGAPVISASQITYKDLIGEFFYDNEGSNFTTDFLKIKSGLLHAANGGFLILQASDVFSDCTIWDALKKSLKTKEIVIENVKDTTSFNLSTIKPEPIPLNVKVILVGDGNFYDIMYEYDDIFPKLFKIYAPFHAEMEKTTENINKLVSFIKSYAKTHNLLSFEPCAIKSIINHSERLSENRLKLTTKFSKLGEILYEASAWAKLDSDISVKDIHIEKAIYEKESRVNYLHHKVMEHFKTNMILLPTDGFKIGQVNGLAVIDTALYTFSKPVKITATTYMGKAGVIDIEKECKMSGNIHDKGVNVLSGFLGNTFSKKFPASFSSRICFEQSYNGVDGDSASMAELFALLSSLSDLAINQGIAVTGSMNQMGEVQPVGCITLKIEGFFDLCKERGLTGNHAVIIPCQNIEDLVLKKEVIDAIKDDKFNIYPIQHISEGMEILTGYSYDEIRKRAMSKLKRFYKAMK